MQQTHQEAAANRPSSLFPLKSWLRWGWHGLFVPGHTSYQFLRFCLVGASGVVVNYLVMWGSFDGLGLHRLISSALAFFISTINNFALNKIFTFHDQVRGFTAVLGQYLRFLSVTILGLGITMAVMELLVRFAGVDPVNANLAGVLVATISNFLGNKLYAFKRRS